MDTTYRESPEVATLSASRKHCHTCATVLDARAELCPKCGVRQHAQGVVGAATSSRNRIAAALLALFFGGIGVHKFYLGQTRAGLLYLCFFWTLIPSILAFVAFITLLTQSDADFARKYPD